MNKSIDKDIKITYIKMENNEPKITENYIIKHFNEENIDNINQSININDPSVDITSIKIGESNIIEGILESKKLKETSQKKPYYSVSILLNNNRKAISNVWSNLPVFKCLSDIDEKSSIKLRCTLVRQVYSSTWEIKIEQIQKIENANIYNEQNNLIRNAKNDWMAINNSITDIRLKELSLSMITRKDVLTNLNSTPASFESSYSFDGGLIIQLAKTAQIVKNNCLNFNIKPDIPLFISLIYDLGKTKCITKNTDGKYEKNKTGTLLSYSLATVKLLLEQINLLENTKNITFSDEEKELFIHLICSIKGNYENNASLEPSTLEATILNLSYTTLHATSKFNI
ncbi:MAG: hypothetical protein IJH34_00060 [Romboutsia sp.]|nr:hypothetical protein [Romboutsia sp.]